VERVIYSGVAIHPRCERLYCCACGNFYSAEGYVHIISYRRREWYTYFRKLVLQSFIHSTNANTRTWMPLSNFYTRRKFPTRSSNSTFSYKRFVGWHVRCAASSWKMIAAYRQDRQVYWFPYILHDFCLRLLGRGFQADITRVLIRMYAERLQTLRYLFVRFMFSQRWGSASISWRKDDWVEPQRVRLQVPPMLAKLPLNYTAQHSRNIQDMHFS
jgi:hypothetical protein